MALFRLFQFMCLQHYHIFIEGKQDAVYESGTTVQEAKTQEVHVDETYQRTEGKS